MWESERDRKCTCECMRQLFDRKTMGKKNLHNFLFHLSQRFFFYFFYLLDRRRRCRSQSFTILSKRILLSSKVVSFCAFNTKLQIYHTLWASAFLFHSQIFFSPFIYMFIYLDGLIVAYNTIHKGYAYICIYTIYWCVEVECSTLKSVLTSCWSGWFTVSSVYTDLAMRANIFYVYIYIYIQVECVRTCKCVSATIVFVYLFVRCIQQICVCVF